MLGATTGGALSTSAVAAKEAGAEMTPLAVTVVETLVGAVVMAEVVIVEAVVVTRGDTTMALLIGAWAEGNVPVTSAEPATEVSAGTTTVTACVALTGADVLIE